MTDSLPSRDDAWRLLCEHTHKEGLRKHALAVEAAMREYARHFGEDEERWGITGLLHDFDYERWPDPENHPYRGVEILEREGYPEDVRQAILGHASYTGVPRESRMARALYAVDELSGFVVAVALVKPNQSLDEVDVRSVRKKLKDKAFARGVHREEVFAGAEELGVEFDQHVERVIAGLQARRSELGL
ncbi:MAG TPA: HD domain-containing protein [Thermoanaerobaculia bacterium]|nr:HD domain-containing protein [Thermoanaerobaculia bacterium]